MINTNQIKIADQGSQIKIYSKVNGVNIQKMIVWCIDYLAKRGFCAVHTDIYDKNSTESPIWVLESEHDCPIAESMGIHGTLLEKERGDAFMLNVLVHQNRPVVSIVGKGIEGIRSGIARLITVSSLLDNRIETDLRSEIRSPFFRIRRLYVAQTGRIAKFKPWTDTLWANWSDDRIKNLAQQLWLFGFNSIEICELRGYGNTGSPYNERELSEKVIPKMLVLADAAHEFGLQVSQHIWGQSLFEENHNLCWNNPAERAMMRAEYTRLAQTYADYVDHIVVHVGDPGGCHRNGCDSYRVPQGIATAIITEYQKINPSCTVTLSAWANFGLWKDFHGEKFLDESHSRKSMAIALHRWYDRDMVKQLKATGRDIDIWGWYLSDYELSLNLHLLMRRLDRYFTSLPDEASDDIRAISTEINFFGLPNLINAYISAQKMWEPRRSLEEIEQEFCRGTFGPAHADQVLSVYHACEKYARPEIFRYFIPETDCVGFKLGSPEYNKILDDALEKAQQVVIEDDALTSLVHSTSPRWLYTYLYRQLQLTRIFSHATARIQAMKEARGNDTAGEDAADIIRKAVAEAEPYKENLDYDHFLAKMRAMAGGDGSLQI